MLFNIYFDDMDSGTEGSFSKSVDDTKLCGVTEMLKGRDLDKVER